MIAEGITSQGELDELLGGLDIAKGAEYTSSFANLYIEMIAEVASATQLEYSADGLRPRLVAAGGPAGGFGAVVPPWYGAKSLAVTRRI